jgi:hypothetical protein
MTPRRHPTTLTATLWLIAGAAWTAPAAGHFGIPRAIGVMVDPTNPDRFALESDNWGVVMTDDGGQTYTWICAEAYGDDSLGLFHSPMVMLPGGSVLVAGNERGLWRSTSDACGWEKHPTLTAQPARDVREAPDGSDVWVLTAGVSTTTAGSALWRSTDGAESFEAWTPALPTDVLASSVAVPWDVADAPVVVGLDTATAAAVLLTFDEGTSSWTRRALENVPSDGTLEVWVHPADSQLVVVRVVRPPTSQVVNDAHDDLYGSTDGGQTFTQWLAGTSSLPGLALSPDGQTLAVAGPAEGLLLADVPALRTSGGAAWTQRSATAVWGLRWTDAGLLGGLDDFAKTGERAWLGRWDESASAFSPMMSICDVQKYACDASSETAAACHDVFIRLQGFQQAILEGARCRPPADGGADGGTSEGDGTSSGGCGCSLAPRRGSGWLALVALGAGAAIARRRTRRQGTVQR